MKAWRNKYTDELQNWYPDYNEAQEAMEEGVFFTLADFQAHNEKIAMAAFEAGNKNVSHKVIEGGLMDGVQVTSWKQSVNEYIQSPEYKELVGVK